MQYAREPAVGHPGAEVKALQLLLLSSTYCSQKLRATMVEVSIAAAFNFLIPS